MQEELRSFVENYSKEDFDRIKFDWNGKHGDEFEDKNLVFRTMLAEFMKEDFSFSPDQLIIDMYLALAECGEQSFGIYLNFHLFANELLNRGGAKYFTHYMEGAKRSMDTYISSGRDLKISKEILNEICDLIQDKIDTSDKDSKLYEGFQERFDFLLKQYK